MDQAVAYTTLGITVSLAVLKPRLGWRDLRFTPGRAALFGVTVLAGLLISMFVKTLKIHVDYAADLRASFGDDVFDNPVPAAKDFKEAVTLRKALAEHKPRSAAAKAMEAVADEMLARVAARCGVVPGAPGFAVVERIGA